MKFLAPFAYTAEVLPRGSRKPRREVLFATMEHEIVDLSHSDVAHDAVVVTPAAQHEAQARVSLSGYDGKLWSPILVRPAYAGKHKSDVDSFLRTCASVYPASSRTDNPLSSAYDEIYGPREFSRNDAGSMLERYREDLFDGKIIDNSDRGAAIERFRERARDIILVDDTIYVRRPEPFWETTSTIAPTVTLHTTPSWVSGAHRFRIDRLNDVQTWVRTQYRGEFPVRGEIHQFDPAFLSRNDLSFFLTGHLRDLIEKSMAYLPYLDAATVLAWHRLAQSKDLIGARVNDAFPSDLEATLQDTRRLQDALTSARLPASYLATHEAMLREVLTPLFKRLDFEMTRAPRPAMDAADDVAIAQIAKP